MIGDEIELELGTATFGKRADMGTGMGPFVRTRHLKEVFACLFLRHVKFVLCEPSFDAFDCGRGREPAANVFTIEGDANFDASLTVKMEFYTRLFSKNTQTGVVGSRLFGKHK